MQDASRLDSLMSYHISSIMYINWKYTYIAYRLLISSTFRPPPVRTHTPKSKTNIISQSKYGIMIASSQPSRLSYRFPFQLTPYQFSPYHNRPWPSHSTGREREKGAKREVGRVQVKNWNIFDKANKSISTN